MRAVHRLLTIAGALLLLTGTIAGVVNREVLSVAVDFHDRGDRFGVVDTLNGVG